MLWVGNLCFVSKCSFVCLHINVVRPGLLETKTVTEDSLLYVDKYARRWAMSSVNLWSNLYPNGNEWKQPKKCSQNHHNMPIKGDASD